MEMNITAPITESAVAGSFALMARLDHEAAAYDFSGPPVATLPPPEIIARLVRAFQAGRWWLVGVSTLAWLPQRGREILVEIREGLDALTLMVDPDFKAGKDV